MSAARTRRGDPPGRCWRPIEAHDLPISRAATGGGAQPAFEDDALKFFRTPNGEVYNVDRIGGVKAVQQGYLLTSTRDEILVHVRCPVAVAMAWRDATAEVLEAYRPGRSLPRIDWLAVAATVDEAWARANGWEAPAVPVPAAVSAALGLSAAPDAGPVPAPAAVSAAPEPSAAPDAGPGRDDRAVKKPSE